MIDFDSVESHVLLNPRLSEADRRRLSSSPLPPSHVALATSGSTGEIRLAALSKQALLASARAVNARLESDGHDVWAAVLPIFHVGGLGVFARAHASGARVVATSRWEAAEFVALCESAEITLASLVPAQLHDLVSAGLRPPRSLRLVLVGGGAVGEDLARSAARLRWPLLATYASTECGSTIGVRESSSSGPFELLGHIDARQTEEGALAFHGPSLFSGYIEDGELRDPKIEGWFVSDDLGEVSGRSILFSGRTTDFVKIGGESVDLRRLDALLRSVAGDEAAVFAVSDERLGAVIHVATTGDPAEVEAAFNELVLPFERARRVHRVSSIPRTELGKLRREELRRQFGP